MAQQHGRISHGPATLLSPTKSSHMDTILITSQFVEVFHSKNGQLYIFRYARDLSQGMMQAIGRMAASNETDFSWYDAALVTRSMRDANDKYDEMHAG